MINYKEISLKIVDEMGFLILDFEDLNIYHYTSTQEFQGVIESESLRFTDRNYLNDSSEGIYTLKLIKENLEYINSRNPSITKEVEDISNNKQKIIIKEAFHTYQCSFSLEPDNLALWNYYT